MAKVNFEAIKEHVSIQYGDLSGVIQMDLVNGMIAIDKICDYFDYDITKKFIVGCSLGDSSLNGIDINSKVTFTIYFVDIKKYGDTFDEIEPKLIKDQSINVSTKSFHIPYEQMSKYIKRYKLLAFTDIIKSVDRINIVPEESD